MNKFILNEGFILNELYSLTEETDFSDASDVKIIKSIIDSCGKLSAAVDAIFNYAKGAAEGGVLSTAEVEKLSKIADDAIGTTDAETIIGKGKEFVTFLGDTKFGDAGTDAYPELSRLYQSIASMTDPADAVKNATNVRSLLIDADRQISHIFKQVNDKNEVEFKVVKDAVIENKDKLNAVKAVSNVFKDTDAEGKTIAEAEKADCIELAKSLDSLVSVEVLADGNLVVDQITAFMKELPAATEIKELAKKVRTALAAEKEVDAEDEEASKATKDLKFSYDKEFSATADKTAFWKRFYADNKIPLWKKHIELLKSISTAFEQECTVYGFSEARNPFVKFLNKIIFKSATLTEVMNKEAYIAIHDAVVNRELEQADLVGAGKLGKKNIIFCADFYSKKRSECIELLEAQKTALDTRIDELNGEGEIKEALDAADADDTGILFAQAVLFGLSESNISTGISEASVEGAKLANLDDIKDRMSEAIGYSVDSKKKKWTAGTTATLMGDVKSAADGAVLIYLLSLRLGADAVQLEKYFTRAEVDKRLPSDSGQLLAKLSVYANMINRLGVLKINDAITVVQQVVATYPELKV